MKKFLSIAVVSFFLFTHSPLEAQDDEVIIRGTDRSPTKSSFEYNKVNGSDSPASELENTTDFPGVDNLESEQKPKLQKEFTAGDKPVSPTDEKSSDWDPQNVFFIILGVGVVVALAG